MKKSFRLNVFAVATAALTLAACSNTTPISGFSAETADKRNNLVSPNLSNPNSGSQANDVSRNPNSGSQANNASRNPNSGSQANNPSRNPNSVSQANNPSRNPSSGSQNSNSANNGNNSGSQNDNSANNGNNSGSQNDNSANNGNNSGSQNDNSANNGNNSGSQNDNSANNGNNSGSQNDNSASNGNNSDNQDDNSASNNNSDSQNDNSVAVKAAIEQGFGDADGNIARLEKFTNDDGEKTDRFAADVVSISSDGSVTHQVIEDDKGGYASKSFTLNNIRINLLNKSEENQYYSDKEEGLSLRELDDLDLEKVSPTGDLTDAEGVVHEDNPSWVGSIGSGSIVGERGEKDVAGSYRHLRYGVFNHNDGTSHLFVFGLPAEMKRSSGLIEYRGSAIVGKNGEYNGLEDAMSATANFDTKQVDVRISREDETDLRFGGTIKGNSFEGTQNGIYTKGGFYGQTISESSTSSNLGGMFSIMEGKEKGMNGVYGGAQSKSSQ